MFVDEVVGGRFDSFVNTKDLGNAFNEVGFAGTKISLEGDNERIEFKQVKVGLEDGLG